MENTYIYYDYETGVETKFTLSDNDILLKLGTLSKSSSIDDGEINNVEDELVQNYTLRDMSSGINASPLSVLEGKELVKVPSLVGHYKKITMLQLGRKDENICMAYLLYKRWLYGENE